MDADYFQTDRLQLTALRKQLQAATAEQQVVVRVADQLQQMQHMVYAACEVLEEVLDESSAGQALCLVYICLEILKRDPSPVNPYLSPLCLFFQRAYAKLQYSVQARGQLKDIADYMESANMLPLGIVKSLQTLVSRGFDSEMQEFAEAHSACIHYHILSHDVQKLVSRDWLLDGYKQLAAELSDTTTEELRIRLQPQAANFLSQATAGVIMCDSIIGGAMQARAAATSARDALQQAGESIEKQIRRDLYCLHNFHDVLGELLDKATAQQGQDDSDEESNTKKRRRKHLNDDDSDFEDDGRPHRDNDSDSDQENGPTLDDEDGNEDDDEDGTGVEVGDAVDDDDEDFGGFQVEEPQETSSDDGAQFSG